MTEREKAEQIERLRRWQVASAASGNMERDDKVMDAADAEEKEQREPWRNAYADEMRRRQRQNERDMHGRTT